MIDQTTNNNEREHFLTPALGGGAHFTLMPSWSDK